MTMTNDELNPFLAWPEPAHLEQRLAQTHPMLERAVGPLDRPKQVTRAVVLVNAIYELAMASDDELRLALSACEPYDRDRLTLAFSVIRDELDP